MKGKATTKVETSVFIGNAHTKEVHHSGFAVANCQLEKITVTNKRVFQTLDEAREQAFDTCAYCFASKK